jgi:hypothetical protein
MQLRWTKGLESQQKTDLKAQLKASQNILNRLSTLLQEDIDSCIKAQEARDSYDSPSWAMYQADAIGETRAYRKILRLLDLNKENH